MSANRERLQQQALRAISRRLRANLDWLDHNTPEPGEDSLMLLSEYGILAESVLMAPDGEQPQILCGEFDWLVAIALGVRQVSDLIIGPDNQPTGTRLIKAVSAVINPATEGLDFPDLPVQEIAHPPHNFSIFRYLVPTTRSWRQGYRGEIEYACLYDAPAIQIDDVLACFQQINDDLRGFLSPYVMGGLFAADPEDAAFAMSDLADAVPFLPDNEWVPAATDFEAVQEKLGSAAARELRHYWQERQRASRQAPLPPSRAPFA